MPNSMSAFIHRSRSPMPRLLPICTLVVFALALGGCKGAIEGWFEGQETEAAKVRLTFVMDSVVAGDYKIKQKVLCVFLKNSKNGCSTGELDQALTAIDRWLKARDLHRGVDSYEIVEALEIPDSRVVTYWVHLKINGADHYVLLPERSPIKWTTQRTRPDVEN